MSLSTWIPLENLLKCRFWFSGFGLGSEILHFQMFPSDIHAAGTGNILWMSRSKTLYPTASSSPGTFLELQMIMFHIRIRNFFLTSPPGDVGTCSSLRTTVIDSTWAILIGRADEVLEKRYSISREPLDGETWPRGYWAKPSSRWALEKVLCPGAAWQRVLAPTPFLNLPQELMLMVGLSCYTSSHHPWREGLWWAFCGRGRGADFLRLVERNSMQRKVCVWGPSWPCL